jgi:hypothetical protein
MAFVLESTKEIINFLSKTKKLCDVNSVNMISVDGFLSVVAYNGGSGIFVRRLFDNIPTYEDFKITLDLDVLLPLIDKRNNVDFSVKNNILKIVSGNFKAKLPLQTFVDIEDIEDKGDKRYNLTDDETVKFLSAIKSVTLHDVYYRKELMLHLESPDDNTTSFSVADNAHMAKVVLRDFNKDFNISIPLSTVENIVTYASSFLDSYTIEMSDYHISLSSDGVSVVSPLLQIIDGVSVKAIHNLLSSIGDSGNLDKFSLDVREWKRTVKSISSALKVDGNVCSLSFADGSVDVLFKSNRGSANEKLECVYDDGLSGVEIHPDIMVLDDILNCAPSFSTYNMRVLPNKFIMIKESTIDADYLYLSALSQPRTDKR